MSENMCKEIANEYKNNEDATHCLHNSSWLRLKLETKLIFPSKCKKKNKQNYLSNIKKQKELQIKISSVNIRL